MESNLYWQLFLRTGAPEAYLMYCDQVRSEENHVSERSGDHPAGNGLQ